MFGNRKSLERKKFSWSWPNGLRFSGAAPIDGCHIVAETGAEKGTISLDAKWRPLQARVGRLFGILLTGSLISSKPQAHQRFVVWRTHLSHSPALFRGHGTLRLLLALLKTRLHLLVLTLQMRKVP